MSDDFETFSTIDDLAMTLQRLGPVTGGDILVFHNIGDEIFQQEIMEYVLHYYAAVAQLDPDALAKSDQASAHIPLLAFLQDGQTIEHLNEADMLRAGWTRTKPHQIEVES